MNRISKVTAGTPVLTCAVLSVLSMGQSPNPPADKPQAPPSNAPQPANPSKEALLLPGLELAVPKDWKREEVSPGPMAPQAVFRIPKAEGDAEDGIVRITHFREMKGKDDINIERWLGQVTKPDGKPHTRADAKIISSESGGVKLTIVDLTGSVKMTGWTQSKPNHRMIAAIVDHPQGPHYVVAAGGVKTMEQSAPVIDAFLKSVKVK